LPMKGSDRRQSPRTTVEKFAYINIDPSNGGSVLNVSKGGLCFCSIAPVLANGTIRFWLSEQNRRVEVDSELAWTDETRKTGGLRFTTLSEEAREQIRNWISPPTTPLGADDAYAPSVPSPPAFPVSSASRPAAKAASHNSEPLEVVSPMVRVPTPWRGFSGGLAIGLLVSALVAAAFLFHSHRHQFGESLIRMGERLAAKPDAQMQPVSPAPQTSLTARRTASLVGEPIPVSRPGKLQPQLLANPAKPQQLDLEPAKPAAVRSTPSAGSAFKGPVTSLAAISSTRPTISLPTTAVAPAANVIPEKLSSIPKPEPESHRGGRAENLSKETARSTPGIYLEVGKFKDALGADKVRDKLTRLGFHATVNQKPRLWMNSYYLLVGPYEDDKAEAARKNLVSHGYKPLAYERGSRAFPVYGGCDTMSRLLRSGMERNDAPMSVDECMISWESYSSHAIVKFVQDDYVVAKADGRWVNRGLRFERDAFIYRKNGDGSRTLLEIQFAGMSQALVFGKSS
jgi:cell division protein FtsN